MAHRHKQLASARHNRRRRAGVSSAPAHSRQAWSKTACALDASVDHTIRATGSAPHHSLPPFFTTIVTPTSPGPATNGPARLLHDSRTTTRSPAGACSCDFSRSTDRPLSGFERGRGGDGGDRNRSPPSPLARGGCFAVYELRWFRDGGRPTYCNYDQHAITAFEGSSNGRRLPAGDR